MPKQPKEADKSPLPTDLPMPKYEYQSPSNEGFSSSVFRENNAKNDEDKFCLQNVGVTF